ncbi:MAG: hypothetical protein Q9195_007634 [Heterodermia aff. obscurata]
MPKFKFRDLEGDIQGDILLGGLPKRTQTFLFFSIDSPDRASTDPSKLVKDFQTKLLKEFVPLITTAKQAKVQRDDIEESRAAAKKHKSTAPILPMAGVNISFTKKGLNRLAFKRDLGDEGKEIGGDFFNKGMLDGAKALGDPGTGPDGKFIPNWDKNWLPGATVKDTSVKDNTVKDTTAKDIHGLIMVTGDNQQRVDKRLTDIRGIFSGLISEVHKLEGNVRPGDQKGHEHFGFLDGVSQPAVLGVDDPKNINRGQQVVPPEVILLLRENDTEEAKKKAGPNWALNGSFLAFRHLSQLVPEFNTFLEKNAIPGLPPKEGAELLGARFMGRWKSGAPIAVTPYIDDPAMGTDPNRNDDFDFDFDQKSQVRCPYAAHIRKTNPRGDLSLAVTASHRIIRSGIPYGPEVSGKEALNGKTEETNDRGLLFVSYQSDLSKGFTFIQQDWANNEDFIVGKDVKPGFDPIIGQNPKKTSNLSITGADFKEPTPLQLTQWVKPKGRIFMFYFYP